MKKIYNAPSVCVINGSPIQIIAESINYSDTPVSVDKILVNEERTQDESGNLWNNEW